ncbi:triose-phosphate isomerase [Sphingorhabdus lutea]|uniref:Triosephosphate isomerase n=1 Tax=Sphingorhabdus lutea TaxID=1913578 RepID=A0A1L3JBU4_9SPHN|nr:triose-phosphate isomerase [Sphingorhabdus lutea]APG62617.1 triose-phosphate isomerase [Sphingorhabdus lutea]
MKKHIIGNWKMNGMQSHLTEIQKIDEIAALFDNIMTGLCVPATLIYSAHKDKKAVIIGAQDCHQSKEGAHTGCLSAAMVKEAGAKMVILGHSERRQDQGENSRLVSQKADAAIDNNITPIICVGESLAQRESGQAEKIVSEQLLASLPSNKPQKMIIAYEPIWAIGTGKIPQMEEVREIHEVIFRLLTQKYGDAANDYPILYGGSMNGENASELLKLAHVDGGLVGGASLTADKFAPILKAASQNS